MFAIMWIRGSENMNKKTLDKKNNAQNFCEDVK